MRMAKQASFEQVMKFATQFLLPLILASAGVRAQDEVPPVIDQAVYLQQADLALREGRLTQAGQMIAWLESNNTENSRDDVALLKAEYAIASRDVAAAEAALKAISDPRRNLCRLQTAKAWVSANRRAYDDAIIALAEAGGACPEDAGIWNLLGLVFIRKGEGDAAAEAFGRARNLAPDDAGILNNHAMALLQRGEVDLALQQFDLAAAKAPDNDIVAANRDFVSGMLGLTPERRLRDSDAVFSKRLVNYAQGAKAAANDRQANTLFSRALLAMDRFDQKIWSQLEHKEDQR
jgi:Flp pilus assembly protein TadD